MTSPISYYFSGLLFNGFTSKNEKKAAPDRSIPGTAQCAADSSYVPCSGVRSCSEVSFRVDRAFASQILGTGAAVTAESVLSLALTNRRFHQQINTISGGTGRLLFANHFRCIQFFAPARLTQFSVLLGGKKIGMDAYDSITGTSGTTASKVAGGMFSTLMGLPFPAPMENVLVQGLTAGAKGHAFQLTSVLKDTYQSIRGGKFRALGATAYREMPYGFCLATLPGLFSEQITRFGASQSSADSIGSLLASVFYTTLSHPFDVIKTAIQSRPDLPDNTFLVGRQVVTERGITALSSGYLMRLAKVAGTFFIIGQGSKVATSVFSDILSPELPRS